METLAEKSQMKVDSRKWVKQKDTTRLMIPAGRFSLANINADKCDLILKKFRRKLEEEKQEVI